MQLWWVPASRMTPKAERPTGLGNIDHYELSNGHDEPTRYSTDDVIHFRDGLDPSNPCLGKSGVSSLLQEILVDEQAATLTSTLMRNAGHPGAIIGPQAGSIPQEAARQIEETYNRKFSGSGAGRVMITPQPLDLKTIAFTPAQMEMRAQRAIPEERATAVIGVNAAVVGLGSGLASTKVGATLREYREEAFESTLIPLYRDLAAHLTQQLLPQFGLEEDWRLTFDLRGVRVLQEDELARVERIARLVTDGIVMVSEGRRMLGIPVAEDGSQDIYLRPANLRMIPEGPLRIQTNPIVPNRDSQVDSQELVRGMIGEALSENGHASATSAKRGVRK